jgi:formiminotetrahydrofolate cyclodeaminase
VATLAGRLEREGNPNLRGDAQAAALLADGAAQAAVVLVHINRDLGNSAP